jgi:hypothetical protein
MHLPTRLRHWFLDWNVGTESEMGLNTDHQKYFMIFHAPENDPMFLTVEPCSSSTCLFISLRHGYRTHRQQETKGEPQKPNKDNSIKQR